MKNGVSFPSGVERQMIKESMNTYQYTLTLTTPYSCAWHCPLLNIAHNYKYINAVFLGDRNGIDHVCKSRWKQFNPQAIKKMFSIAPYVNRFNK